MSYSNLSSLFTDIADAIRTKTGSTDPIAAEDFPTEIASIPSSSGATIEAIDCIQYSYHSRSNTIIIPCSAAAVTALQSGHLSGALIPTWRSSNNSTSYTVAFMQQSSILGFFLKDSAVTQIFAAQGGSSVPLNTMQAMRNHFTIGSNDYSGQGSTGTNLSIYFDSSGQQNPFMFIDSIITDSNLRWQAILAY